MLIFVTPDGTGDGTSWANACSLETAVASAPLSDRVQIWVQKGTCYPSKMLIIPDSVKVYGGFAGAETNLSQRNFSANPTIIDGQQKIGSIFRLENSAEINGFTIQNGNAKGNSQKNGTWFSAWFLREGIAVIHVDIFVREDRQGKMQVIHFAAFDNFV